MTTLSYSLLGAFATFLDENPDVLGDEWVELAEALDAFLRTNNSAQLGRVVKALVNLP